MIARGLSGALLRTRQSRSASRNCPSPFAVSFARRPGNLTFKIDDWAIANEPMKNAWKFFLYCRCFDLVKDPGSRISFGKSFCLCVRCSVVKCSFSFHSGLCLRSWNFRWLTLSFLKSSDSASSVAEFQHL